MTPAKAILELRDVRFTYKQRQKLFKTFRHTPLRSVSLVVERGETLAIIGRNGSGKSTLLRVIAGIYRPDKGEVIRRCNKVSLLSLSLGFDPQLTGRENAVISGMLSGSPRTQVEAELDEILAFAELGRFANEPIKTYSTGMRARLGFAVATKLRTELLLLDEILSVGDAKFRKKAERAIKERITSNQSVVMVSHSHKQVEELCDRVAWLEGGVVHRLGPPKEVIPAYLEFVEDKKAENSMQ